MSEGVPVHFVCSLSLALLTMPGPAKVFQSLRKGNLYPILVPYRSGSKSHTAPAFQQAKSRGVWFRSLLGGTTVFSSKQLPSNLSGTARASVDSV